MGELWMASIDSNKLYKWITGPEGWSTAVTNSSAGSGATIGGIHGDGDALFYIETGAQKVWKYDGSTFTAISTGTITAQSQHIAGLGPYVYVLDWKTGQVWEIAKDGGGTTSIDEPLITSDLTTVTGGVFVAPPTLIVPGDNRLYTLNITTGDTYVREITPTTAAGPGYGAQIAHLNGFEAQAGWWFNGTLFVAGSNWQWSKDEVVLYIRPGESFGSIGRVRQGQETGIFAAAENNGAMLLHGFVTQHGDAASDSYASSHWEQTLWLVDAVSGGFCAFCSSDTYGVLDSEVVLGPVEFLGDWFFSHDYTGGTSVYKTHSSEIAEEGFFTTPLHDFDLADEKVLSSVRVILEDDMPTDWEIKVYYGLDVPKPTTLALTMDDGDGTVAEAAITSAASPITFNHLSIRVEFIWEGTGQPTTKPVLLQLEVRAQLAIVPKRWRLLLDCMDDHSAGQNSYKGAKKLEKIKASIAKKTVSLIDGYTDRSPKESDTYDAIIDNYRIVLSRPGEGVVYVELVEVL
jgi:hypothetical protein